MRRVGACFSACSPKSPRSEDTTLGEGDSFLGHVPDDDVIVKVSRVAVLWNPATPATALWLRETEVASLALGVQLQPLEARSLNDFDSAIAAMTTKRAGASRSLEARSLNDFDSAIAAMTTKRAGASRESVDQPTQDPGVPAGLIESSTVATCPRGRLRLACRRSLPGRHACQRQGGADASGCQAHEA